MPKFNNLPVDWSAHTELNTDTFEQSAHGMKEQPEDCTCDFCAEESFFGRGNSSMTSRCSTSNVKTSFRSPKPIEESKIPQVDGCKCHRRRCHMHQFRLFIKEHQGLVNEHSKLMDDWAFTIYLDEQLQDFEDLHMRHCQFLKRLSDAGFAQRYRDVDFSTLRKSEE